MSFTKILKNRLNILNKEIFNNNTFFYIFNFVKFEKQNIFREN